MKMVRRYPYGEDPVETYLTGLLLTARPEEKFKMCSVFCLDDICYIAYYKPDDSAILEDNKSADPVFYSPGEPCPGKGV